MQLHILNNLDLRDANWTSVVLLQPRTNAITVTSLVVEHVTTRVELDHLGAASDVGLANAARLMKCFFDWTALELFQSRADSTGWFFSLGWVHYLGISPVSEFSQQAAIALYTGSVRSSIPDWSKIKLYKE